MGFALNIGNKWESCGYLEALSRHVPRSSVVRHLKSVLETLGVEEVLGQDYEVGGHEYLHRGPVGLQGLIRPFTHMHV